MMTDQGVSYSPKSSRVELRWLIVALLVGLLNGIIYILIVPPWQHYDEPNHFEYAWLVAHLNRARPEDVNPQLSQQILGSMYRNKFFGEVAAPANLADVKTLTEIGGYSQLDEPPLYYWLASFPLRFLSNAQIETQLTSARFISLLFLLISVFCAWGFTCELTKRGNPLRLLVPLSVAMLPSFVDSMTAVNNDAAAVGVFCFFLWGSVRIIRRGINWVDFFWVLFSAVLCIFTKSTAMIALALMPAALIFSILRNRWRVLGWAILFLSGILVIVSSLTWGDARYYYRSTTQPAVTRAVSEKSVVGDFVLQLEPGSPVSPPWLVPLFQPSPGATGINNQKQIYSLGVWMWANQPARVKSPILGNNQETVSDILEIGSEPVFHAISLTTTTQPFNRVWVDLAPISENPPKGLVIYYDGIVLAQGSRPATTPPQYDDPSGQSGVWGGLKFENLLRNGSAETAGPRFREWFDRLGARVLPDHILPSFVLSYISDWRAMSWSYRLSAERVWRTFWGNFGWGQVPLLGHKPYRIYGLFTLVGLLSALIWCALAIYKRRGAFPWEILLFFLLVLICAWGAVMIRGSIYTALTRLFLPVARYGFVAIIPTVTILVLGWWKVLCIFVRRLKIPESFGILVWLVILTIMNIYSIISIVRFFQI